MNFLKFHKFRPTKAKPESWRWLNRRLPASARIHQDVLLNHYGLIRLPRTYKKYGGKKKEKRKKHNTRSRCNFSHSFAPLPPPPPPRPAGLLELPRRTAREGEGASLGITLELSRNKEVEISE